MCAALGCRVLLACSSTSPHASADPTGIARDLRRLAMLGLPLRIRSPTRACRGAHDQRVHRRRGTSCSAPTAPTWAGHRPHHASPPRPAGRWRRSPPNASSSSSCPTSCGRRCARSRSASPPRAPSASSRRGRAQRAAGGLVTRLDRMGYRGDYSFEVFNDDYQQMPLPTVAARARRAAIWLGEDERAALDATAQPDAAAAHGLNGGGRRTRVETVPARRTAGLLGADGHQARRTTVEATGAADFAVAPRAWGSRAKCTMIGGRHGRIASPPQAGGAPSSASMPG